MKRFAITGATGFVGSALLRALDARVAAGEEISVRALERRAGSVPRQGRPWLEVVPGDVRDSVPPDLLAEAEALFHLATLGIDQGEGFAATNVAGTRRLIESAGDALRVVLYTSSVSVYGQGPQRGEDEDALPIAPETPLAKSRAAAEEILAEAMEARGGSAIFARPRYILGEGDRHTLPGLSKLAQAGWLLGEGSQRFSVIDVADYAQILLRAAERQLASEVPFRGGLHVGYREGLSLSDLLGALASAAGTRQPKRRLRVPGFVVSGLAAFPNRKTRRGATIYQLFAQDHHVGVDRLASWIGEELVAKSPHRVLQDAIAWQSAQADAGG